MDSRNIIAWGMGLGLLLMVVLLPAWLLDGLLVFNLTVSTGAVLLAIYGSESWTFFPTLLMLTTLLRFSLNLSASRIVLTQGWQGKVGQLIPAFGHGVVGESLWLALGLWMVLMFVQVKVISAGAERTARVNAHYTLDAMPGQQMRIDADLHSGQVDADDARLRRREVECEADFYGSMDGLCLFVKAECMAASLLLVVNLLGGLAVATLCYQAPALEALRNSAVLAVGSGLMATLSACLMSVAMSLVVIRSASRADFFPRDLLMQNTVRAGWLLLIGAAAVIGEVIRLSGASSFPSAPFLVLSGTLHLGVKALQRERRAASGGTPQEILTLPAEAGVVVELGRALLTLVDPSLGAGLVGRVPAVRRQLAEELGVLLPEVRFRDNPQLSSHRYSIKVRGQEVGAGETRPGCWLVLGDQHRLQPLRGVRTLEPSYGLPAVWVQAEERGLAEGCLLFDASSVLITHLSEVARRRAADLLDAQPSLDLMGKTQGGLVQRALGRLRLGEIQAVLGNLLRERVSIRELGSILETLVEAAGFTCDTDVLTERVRVRLCSSICKPLTNAQGQLDVLTLGTELETALQQATRRQPHILERDHTLGRHLLAALEGQIGDWVGQPILLTSPELRPALRRLTWGRLPELVVLSRNEIAPGICVRTSVLR